MLKKAEFEGICFAYLHHEAYKEGGWILDSEKPHMKP
jgi:hypothetical protein